MRGTLQNLIETIPQTGRVEWIGVRPARGAAMLELERAQVEPDQGLLGDRFNARPGNPRQVTLMQFEHLAVIAACLGLERVGPETLRRNIVVSGINLLALKEKSIQIGEAMLAVSGICHPCSKMEAALGPGGYNAVRGHGGITARVLTPGIIRRGDRVCAVPAESRDGAD